MSTNNAWSDQVPSSNSGQPFDAQIPAAADQPPSAQPTSAQAPSSSPGQFGQPGQLGQFGQFGGQPQPGQIGQPKPGQIGQPGQFGYQMPAGQFGYRPQPGQFGYQVIPNGFNNQGNPGYGFQATPTPMGYQGAPNQYQPGYGSNQLSRLSRNSQLWAGDLGMTLTGAVFGFGPLGGRRGRFRFLWYIRIALFLIALGAILYVGFVKHQWVINCHDCDTGGD
jgi:hypothetical protein